MARRLTTAEDYESLLSKYDTWMFDCDGVLWHGDRPIEGAVEVLDMLRKRGKLYFSINLSAASSPSGHEPHDQESVFSSLRTTLPSPGGATRPSSTSLASKHMW